MTLQKILLKMCFFHLKLVGPSPPIANGCLTHIPPRGIEKTCRKNWTSVKAHLLVPEKKYKVISQKHL